MSNDPWAELLERRYGKQDGERDTTTTTTIAETRAQIEARVRAQETDRSAQINTVCEWANSPERAAGFIASSASLSDVIAELSTKATARGQHGTRYEQRMAKLRARSQRVDGLRLP